jgi:hypothetical protein
MPDQQASSVVSAPARRCGTGPAEAPDQFPRRWIRGECFTAHVSVRVFDTARINLELHPRRSRKAAACAAAVQRTLRGTSAGAFPLANSATQSRSRWRSTATV